MRVMTGTAPSYRRARHIGRRPYEALAVVEEETRQNVNAPIRKIVVGALGALVLVGAPRAATTAAAVAAAIRARPRRRSQQVCSNASDFTSSVNKLVDDVKSGNFGNAKDQVSNVESSFQALEKSAKNLSSTKKSSVQSELDSVKGTLDDLTLGGQHR